MMISPFVVLLVQAVSYGVLAPAALGLVRWFKARLQRRRGADIWQPYRDIWKLAHKRSNIPQLTSILTVVPPVILACYGLLGLFLPTFFVSETTSTFMASWGLDMDMIFVIYLLGLAKFVTGLAAFDAATPFGVLSSGRQFFFHSLAEPVMLVGVFALALTKHSSNIVSLVFSAVNQGTLATLKDPATWLILIALCLVFLAEAGRIPFDNPGTHLELTMVEQGAHLDFSGRGLALIEWAHAMKLLFFASLLATLAWPWGIATSATVLQLARGILLYVLKLVILLFLLALWETRRGKLRLRSASQPIALALVLALIAVVYLVASQYLGGNPR